VEFDGRRIEDSRELPALVSSYGVGKTAKVSWLHNGDAVTRQVLLEKLPERKELEKRDVLGSANVDNILGVGVRDLDDEDREAMGLGDLEGVLVVQVAAGSPAEGNDIQPGDVITKINLVATRSAADFERAVQNLKNGSYVRINLRRDTATILRVFRIQQ
jgi:serine protease Do